MERQILKKKKKKENHLPLEAPSVKMRNEELILTVKNFLRLVEINLGSD